MSGSSGRSLTPKAWAIAWGTGAPSERGASSTSHTPPGYAPTRLRATSKASRVLPEPPVPVRVSRRVMASSRVTSSSSRFRPTKLVLGAGRLCPEDRAVAPPVCSGE